jgi:hypothetical protein
VPVGVIDAKFKPRYINRRKPSSNEPEAKVTNADIYQLFFYQTRLQVLHGLAVPPRAAIVAPLLGDFGIADASRRKIRYSEVSSGRGSASTLSVLPIALAPVLRSLRISGELQALEAHAPEIAAELRLMAGISV